MKMPQLSRNVDVSSSYVAVTDQVSHRIMVLKADEWAKGREDAVVWTWSASASNGFEGLEASWGLPTDAKIRWNERLGGGYWMVVTDSRGLAAIVPYPQGDSRQWGWNVGGNPHSAELLPNGNIAVAASTGGWVRIYTSSQGPDCGDYVEYPFPGAHGVQWDPERRVLWALGDDDLVALEITGSDAAPVVREVHKVALPTRYGHDLQPVYGNTDRLWVSTGSHVYQYIKSLNDFDESYSNSDMISRANVKSVGNLPSGQVVSAVPDQVIRPESGSSSNDWCTARIDFVNPSMTGILPGAGIYKARVWNPDYN